LALGGSGAGAAGDLESLTEPEISVKLEPMEIVDEFADPLFTGVFDDDESVKVGGQILKIEDCVISPEVIEEPSTPPPPPPVKRSRRKRKCLEIILNRLWLYLGVCK